ncbi:gamma-aminobutyric acid receptor subunit rho-2-like [Penaeus japonicus]|uniref:gamma-aminobutyric acid receptor subunit rho-2-like n=1 Tax=Penaeus japonicus TaxID=27405 RepID=UPI001C717169|nr:gamma-aminobutyric acid receptor subunit rho-2-like [Penaeus japonicus]
MLPLMYGAPSPGQVLAYLPGYTDVPARGGPTVVAFSMKVNGVFEVNLEDMSLLFELYFRVSWQDERLLYPAGDSFLANNNTVSGIHRAAVAPLSAAANVTSMAMSSDFLKKVWVPDIFIRRTRRIYTFRLLQDFQGVIFHSDNVYSHDVCIQAFTSTYSCLEKTIILCAMQFQLGCAMTFEKYPFDTQECMFYITSYSYSIEELTFKWMDMGLSEDAELEKQLANYDFHLVRYNSTECICLACIPQKTACIKVLLVLRRRSLIHVLGSFVPSSLFVMVGWTSLFWPPDVIPGRTVLAITSLLTVTSMYSAIRQSSPATSYVKAIDVWLFMCVLLTMVPLFQYALVLTWRKRRDDIRLQLVKPQIGWQKEQGLNQVTEEWVRLLCVFVIYHESHVWSLLPVIHDRHLPGDCTTFLAVRTSSDFLQEEEKTGQVSTGFLTRTDDLLAFATHKSSL